ncbi:lipopolysaccharide-induced tumor necrosis factor-alpha factor homolog [Phlebotomus argentipes]|uniref:lipopolysaccharide-induced tumor necrosis factor-alpha factor homolog n=1 Tax=Phlebotomus argentipes TaxID=94469 RepID=UPI002892E902|nr:lipopolysaccharide-induced tumor necrosis factor-alpha factor homolog [Phlebotomus argentipes]
MNTQTVIVTSPAVGPSSTGIVCPSCRLSVMTNVRTESTTRTHVIAILLCVFLCWPCVCVPYCMDSCKNANHYCPNCGSFIGTYQK